MAFHQWSKRSLLVLSLSCIVFGVVTLTVISFTKPWVKRPKIVAERIEPFIESIERKGEVVFPGVVRNKGMDGKPLEGGMSEEEKPTVSKPPESSIVVTPRRRLDKKVVIIGGVKIKQDEKTQAEERPNKKRVSGQEIAEEDTKIREKIPQTISIREEPSAPEIEEKSQSFPITSDKVELERGKESIKAISPETSELEEKPFSVRPGEGKAEEKRRKKMEVKTAKTDVKDDQRASSPVKPPSSLVKFETKITGKKSSIEEGERVIQHKQPSLIATEEEVTQFIAEYVERYNQKEIDGFLSLFSPKAIQNQRDGFKEIRRIYSDYFNKSWKLRYYLEDIKIKINQNSVETKGRYKLVQKGKRSWKEKVWRGDIHWVLVRENGALKIRYLDYTPEKSS